MIIVLGLSCDAWSDMRTLVLRVNMPILQLGVWNSLTSGNKKW
jgi:hypothetical protein